MTSISDSSLSDWLVLHLLTQPNRILDVGKHKTENVGVAASLSEGSRFESRKSTSVLGLRLFWSSWFFAGECWDALRNMAQYFPKPLYAYLLNCLLPTCLPTYYALIYLPIHVLTDILTCLLNYLPIYLPIYLPSYSYVITHYRPLSMPVYPPTYWPTCLIGYLPPYPPTDLLNYLPF
jgi:hypothetical protein